MKIKINKLSWTIKKVAKNKLLVEGEEDPLGQTQNVEKTILINSELDKDIAKRTIIHEITHAFIWSYGLDNSLPFDEEQLACFVEVHSSDIIKLSDKCYTKLFETIRKPRKKEPDKTSHKNSN